MWLTFDAATIMAVGRIGNQSFRPRCDISEIAGIMLLHGLICQAATIASINRMAHYLKTKGMDTGEGESTWMNNEIGRQFGFQPKTVEANPEG